ncbi:MAG: DUF3667 domain-containing protein [Flavobacteriaceae bacterium]|nr:DUF3667 domain-containing protein [Flavobacteriaceae bacterium]
MNCKNCNTSITNETNFCPNCGAKVIRNRLTLKNLWEDFREQFFNYDNKLLKTFRTLFTRPEEVIGTYISGTRKKYVNVISYFALALTLSGLQLFVLRKFFPESLDISVLMPENVPNATMDTNWLYDYYSFFFMINIPIYALLSKLTFMGIKKYNYTEHVVVNAYLLAQLSITSTLLLTPIVMLGVNFYVLSNIAILFYAIYVGITLKRLHQLSLKQMLVRILLFVVWLVVFLMIIGIIQVAVAIITGDFEKMVEQERARRGVSYIASSIINWTS